MPDGIKNDEKARILYKEKTDRLSDRESSGKNFWKSKDQLYRFLEK